MTSLTAPQALSHLRLVHHSASVLGVTTSGYAGAAISGSDLVGLISAAVAVITLVLGIAATNSAKMKAAEQRGRDARNDEVARITQWMEFYRQNYASLLQERAGAPQQILPPQILQPPVMPPGVPPPPPPVQGAPS